MFPVLLLALAVLGFLTQGRDDATNQIIAQLGLTNDNAQALRSGLQSAQQSKSTTSIIGVLGLLWSATAVPAAIQYAISATWNTPDRALRARAIGILWGIGGFIILALSFAASGISSWAHLGVFSSVLSILLGWILGIAFWLWMFIALGDRRLSWKTYVPGAILGTVGIEALKLVLAIVPSLVSQPSATYGPLGIALGLFVVIVIIGKLIVYASVTNYICHSEK